MNVLGPRWQSPIEPPPVAPSGLPSAQACRELAQQHLGSQASPDVIELGALQLYENAVRGADAKSHSMLLDKKAQTNHCQYLAGLAALAGSPGSIPLAVARGLQDFNLDLLWPSDGKGLRTFSTPEKIDQVACKLAPRMALKWDDHEVLVTGAMSPEQRAPMAESLDELRQAVGPVAFRQLKTVHVRPFLARSAFGRVSGLVTRNLPSQIFISQLQMYDKPALAHTSSHEFGHLRDYARATMSSHLHSSDAWKSPFGEGGEFDFVSGYARTKSSEDAAETHSHWVKHKDKIEAAPQMWIHANGRLGHKLSWISQKFYDRPVPPLGQRTAQALSDIRAGRAPFENFDDYQEKLQEFLLKWDPASPPPEGNDEASRFLAQMAVQSFDDPPQPGLWQRLSNWSRSLWSN